MSVSKDIVHFTVDLTIHEGKFDEFTGIAQAMLERTQKEPGTLGYDWYFSRDRKDCRLLETYADASAVLAHMAGPTVKELLPKLLALATMDRFEVYGDPGPEATKILAGVGGEIFGLWRRLER